VALCRLVLWPRIEGSGFEPWPGTLCCVPSYHSASLHSGARFSKIPNSFCTRKVVAKSQTLWLQSCFRYIYVTWTEFSTHKKFEVYTRLCTWQSLNTDLLKMALRAKTFPRLPRNDDIITKFFPQWFKMADSFENSDNILHGWAKHKVHKKYRRGIEQ